MVIFSSQSASMTGWHDPFKSSLPAAVATATIEATTCQETSMALTYNDNPPQCAVMAKSHRLKIQESGLTRVTLTSDLGSSSSSHHEPSSTRRTDQFFIKPSPLFANCSLFAIDYEESLFRLAAYSHPRHKSTRMIADLRFLQGRAWKRIIVPFAAYNIPLLGDSSFSNASLPESTWVGSLPSYHLEQIESCCQKLQLCLFHMLDSQYDDGGGDDDEQQASSMSSSRCTNIVGVGRPMLLQMQTAQVRPWAESVVRLCYYANTDGETSANKVAPSCRPGSLLRGLQFHLEQHPNPDMEVYKFKGPFRIVFDFSEHIKTGNMPTGQADKIRSVLKYAHGRPCRNAKREQSSENSEMDFLNNDHPVAR
jgi:hypothetical protein